MGAPGNATILVIDNVEDTSQLDRKGQPAVTKVVSEVTGCKLAPHRGAERNNGTTDYAGQLWDIATPPHAAAIAVKPDGLVWYDDGGQLAGKTVRATYQDPKLGPRDVAEFQVIGAQVLTDFGNAVDHVTILAKSEVG